MESVATQEKRLDYLLDYLKRDCAGKGDFEIPAGYTEKRALLRALVNVRSPRPVTTDFLKIQDAFLQEETRQKGIVRLEDIPACPSNPRISLWQGDISSNFTMPFCFASSCKNASCILRKSAVVERGERTLTRARSKARFSVYPAGISKSLFSA